MMKGGDRNSSTTTKGMTDHQPSQVRLLDPRPLRLPALRLPASTDHLRRRHHRCVRLRLRGPPATERIQHVATRLDRTRRRRQPTHLRWAYMRRRIA